MSNGTDIAAEITAAYAEAGIAVGSGPLIGTITRKGAKSGPDYAPTYAPPTIHSFTIIVGSYSAFERQASSIGAQDVKISASVSDIDPTAADVLTVQGVTYEIVAAMPLKPAGVVLGWSIQARS